MNRYIKAMEIGIANEKEGITYFELKDKLVKDTGYNLNIDSENTFFNWFINNFYYTNQFDGYNHDLRRKFITYQRIIGIDEEDLSHNDVKLSVDIINYLSKKWFLRGEAAKQYLDYLELTEARESSKKALQKADESILLSRKSTKYAFWALIISAVASITSIIFSVIALNKPEPLYPTPPYDVKINQPVQIDDESINKIKVLTKDSLK